jgi:lysophospholipase L1-like esterase
MSYDHRVDKLDTIDEFAQAISEASSSTYYKAPLKNIKWSDQVNPANYSGEYVVFSDLGKNGTTAYSDGLNFIFQERQNGKAYLLPFGDSITATMWNQVTLTGAITVSNGVATATVNIAVGAFTGTSFRIGLATFPGYNGVHTVTGMPTSTTFTFAAPAGAPASETIGQHVLYMNGYTIAQASYINVMRHLSKNRFYIPYNGGVGGDDSSEALLRLNSDIINQKPDRVLILLGTNNVASSADGSINQFVSDMTTIYTTCINAGILVDACTIPPMGPSHANVADVNKNRFLLEANKWIREFARTHQNIYLHDIYNLSTNPAHASGAMIADWTTDSTHFNNKGAYFVGKFVAANYQSWLGDIPDRLPSSQSDGYTFDTSSKNKLLNHMFQGAGPIATSWSTSYTGASNTKVDTTAARTVIADGDTFGQNQVLSLNSSTSGSAGTSIVFQSPIARMTAGKTYVMRVAMHVTKGACATVQPHISISWTENTVVKFLRAGLIDVFDAECVAVLETEPFIYPAGVSATEFYLKCGTTGAATDCIIRWGRASLDEA